jgi:CheY-like chemotaxis protein
MSKPTRLLVSLAASSQRDELLARLANDRITIGSADSDIDLLRHLASHAVDTVVLDGDALSRLSPEQLHDALSEYKPFAPLPIVVTGERETIPARWLRSAERFMVVPVTSPERLLDMTVAALHVGSARLGKQAQEELNRLRESELALHGKKVLIVDDDMRNIFALATVVEDYGMHHVWADNGRDAIRLVAADPSIDAVLMDIMMPEMDGLMTIRELRKLPAGRTLPIVAVTAKAMKGDRERCIAAGAWDYLSKPVDRGDLLAVLHAWLHA